MVQIANVFQCLGIGFMFPKSILFGGSAQQKTSFFPEIVGPSQKRKTWLIRLPEP